MPCLQKGFNGFWGGKLSERNLVFTYFMPYKNKIPKNVNFEIVPFSCDASKMTNFFLPVSLRRIVCNLTSFTVSVRHLNPSQGYLFRLVLLLHAQHQ